MDRFAKLLKFVSQVQWSLYRRSLLCCQSKREGGWLGAQNSFCKISHQIFTCIFLMSSYGLSACVPTGNTGRGRYDHPFCSDEPMQETVPSHFNNCSTFVFVNVHWTVRNIPKFRDSCDVMKLFLRKMADKTRVYCFEALRHISKTFHEACTICF